MTTDYCNWSLFIISDFLNVKRYLPVNFPRLERGITPRAPPPDSQGTLHGVRIIWVVGVSKRYEDDERERIVKVDFFK